MMDTDPGKHRITVRLTPCTCGCQGADPWHKPHYDRVIKDMVLVPLPDDVPEETSWRHKAVVAIGRVRLPGKGSVPVVLYGLPYNGEWRTYGWDFDEAAWLKGVD